jgi:hypothetical protein
MNKDKKSFMMQVAESAIYSEEYFMLYNGMERSNLSKMFARILISKRAIGGKGRHESYKIDGNNGKV